MLKKEALVVLTNLIKIMAEKIMEPISHVCGWVNAWTSITLARLYYHVIRGYCIPGPLNYWEPDWELVMSLVLVP